MTTNRSYDNGMSDSSSAATDLDLRLVRYFIAVAEHRHFGRAAADLRIAQPSLSRQIRQLEAQVGARLLDRDRQGTRLTEAGDAFLPRARALLRSAAQAAAAASSDAARKAAAGFSVFTAISMLVGAFIACVAAALGGLQRDEHP